MPASSGYHHRPPRVRKLGNPGRLTGPETTPEPVPKPQIGPVGPKRGGTKSARGPIQQQVRAELTPAHQWQPSAGRALSSCGWTPPAGTNAPAAWRDHVKVLIAREVIRRRNEQGGWRFRCCPRRVPTANSQQDRQVTAPYYAEAFAAMPGRCFRFASHGEGGGPIHCPEPPVWRGTFRAPNGRRYRVEACAGHRPAAETGQ